MGWCGQAEAAGYAMLALAGRIGDPKMIERGQRSLDWLAHSPFNEHGFLLNYNADTGQWKDQDPVSQGQAMEGFARAILAGRKLKGVKTERWEEFLKKACALQAERILQPDWKPRNTAEAFFISPLCKGYRAVRRRRLQARGGQGGRVLREAAPRHGRAVLGRHARRQLRGQGRRLGGVPGVPRAV